MIFPNTKTDQKSGITYDVHRSPYGTYVIDVTHVGNRVIPATRVFETTRHAEAEHVFTALASGLWASLNAVLTEHATREAL